MRKIKNETYDQMSLTDPTFWTGEVRFIKCSFRSAYIGVSFQKNKQGKGFDLSKIIFEDCNFQNCNFKGAKGLRARNFINPQNIATTTHLPAGVIKAFEGTGCLYEEKLRTFYNQSTVINHEISGSKRIRSITEFFISRKEVKAQHDTDDEPHIVIASSSSQ